MVGLIPDHCGVVFSLTDEYVLVFASFLRTEGGKINSSKQCVGKKYFKIYYWRIQILSAANCFVKNEQAREGRHSKAAAFMLHTQPAQVRISALEFLSVKFPMLLG